MCLDVKRTVEDRPLRGQKYKFGKTTHDESANAESTAPQRSSYLVEPESDLRIHLLREDRRRS